MIRFLRRAIKNANQVSKSCWLYNFKVWLASFVRNAGIQEKLEYVPLTQQKRNSFKVCCT